MTTSLLQDDVPVSMLLGDVDDGHLIHRWCMSSCWSPAHSNCYFVVWQVDFLQCILEYSYIGMIRLEHVLLWVFITFGSIIYMVW